MLESWLYPLTDSSYDSLENELDNSSESPGFCGRDLKAKTLQGSLDSILTFSDYDQDTDPEILETQTESLHGPKLYPLWRSRARRQKQEQELSNVSQDGQRADPLSLEGQYRQRRSSEPAITYVAKFGPYISAHAVGLTGDGEDEHSKERAESRKVSEKSNTALCGVRSAALEVSSSSLSSLSPDPTHSSFDSLGSEVTWMRRRGVYAAKAHAPSTPSTVNTPLISSDLPDLETCAKGSPPKEPLSWGTLKGCQSLHPNSWLKKGRRLSLTQQDSLDREGEDISVVSRIELLSN